MLGEAQLAGWTPESLLVDAERLGEEAVQIAIAPHRASGTRLVAASRRVMAVLSSQDNVSPVIAVFRHRLAPLPNPGEVSGTWICLELPRDPGNLGTIIRTAHAADAEGLILLGNACDPYGREAVRAAMGSIFHLPIATITEERLKRLAGSWPGDIIAADPRATEDFRQSYRRPAMIMLGSEGAGTFALGQCAGDQARGDPDAGRNGKPEPGGDRRPADLPAAASQPRRGAFRIRSASTRARVSGSSKWPWSRSARAITSCSRRR